MANNNVKVMFNVNDRKRLAALVHVLITIDNKAKHSVKASVVVVAKRKVTMPPRDSAGRFIKSNKQSKHSPSQLKARKKASLFYLKLFMQQDLYLSQTILSLHCIHLNELTSWDTYDRYHSSCTQQRDVSYH